MNTLQLTHFPIDGNLSCFCLFVCYYNDSAVILLVYASLCIYMSFSRACAHGRVPGL